MAEFVDWLCFGADVVDYGLPPKRCHGEVLPNLRGILCGEEVEMQAPSALLGAGFPHQ
jgi:hypothetical protein